MLAIDGNRWQLDFGQRGDCLRHAARLEPRGTARYGAFDGVAHERTVAAGRVVRRLGPDQPRDLCMRSAPRDYSFVEGLRKGCALGSGAKQAVHEVVIGWSSGAAAQKQSACTLDMPRLSAGWLSSPIVARSRQAARRSRYESFDEEHLQAQRQA